MQKIPVTADSESWISLTDIWSKDKHAIYINSTVMDSRWMDIIDIESFGVLSIYKNNSSFSPEYWEEKTVYFTDINYVYVSSYMCPFSLIEGADPNSFQMLNISEGLARDMEADYYYDTKLPYRIEDSVELNAYYRRVSDRIYYAYWMKVDCDAQSFEIIHSLVGNIGRDNEHVFYRDKIIEGADPKSFRFFVACTAPDRPYYLNWDIDFYAIDDNYVYFVSIPFNVKTIKTHYLDSFEVFIENERLYGRDKTYLYTRGKRKKRQDIMQR